MGENERNCNKNCGHDGFFEICYIMKLIQKTTLFHLEFKKTMSKFLESEIMSSEEASGISTVLLMDPGLVF